MVLFLGWYTDLCFAFLRPLMGAGGEARQPRPVTDLHKSNCCQEGRPPVCNVANDVAGDQDEGGV